MALGQRSQHTWQWVVKDRPVELKGSEDTRRFPVSSVVGVVSKAPAHCAFLESGWVSLGMPTALLFPESDLSCMPFKTD